MPLFSFLFFISLFLFSHHQHHSFPSLSLLSNRPPTKHPYQTRHFPAAVKKKLRKNQTPISTEEKQQQNPQQNHHRYTTFPPHQKNLSNPAVTPPLFIKVGSQIIYQSRQFNHNPKSAVQSHVEIGSSLLILSNET